MAGLTRTLSYRKDDRAMRVQNLKFVALPVPEIIRGTQKIWAVHGYADAPFSPKFVMVFCLDVNVPAQFEVRSFTPFLR